MTKIPKKIHYVWFGYNQKSDLIEKCIASWRQFFPDYEIIEWNETNYDVTKCDYMREAYESKKWAFASDYARFDILNEHGGIYLDTDVEFLKPLPASMLQFDGFTGTEPTGAISPGLIFASIPHFWITEEILKEYQKMHFLQDGKPIFKTVNSVITELLEKHCKLQNNTFQVVNGLAIYPSSIFCGYDLDVMEYDIHPDTVSVHHYAGTWVQNTFKGTIQRMLKKIVGIELYRHIVLAKRKIAGTRK